MARTARNAIVALTGAQADIISEEKAGIGRRFVLAITNLNAAGGNDVFISVDEEAAANKGLRAAPGQTITWSTDAGYLPPQMRVTGYAAGATNLAVYEEIES